MKPSFIVWDLETVPDLSGFAAANDLVGVFGGTASDNGPEGSPFEFVADESRISVIYTTASEALP